MHIYIEFEFILLRRCMDGALVIHAEHTIVMLCFSGFVEVCGWVVGRLTEYLYSTD